MIGSDKKQQDLLGRKRGLLLFSGGQDSAICLALSLQLYDHIETIGFGYGQRHKIELAQRQAILKNVKTRFPDWTVGKLGDDHIIDLSGYGAIDQSALTKERAIEIEVSGLPSTFVPGRNLVFFSLAAGLAYLRNMENLIGGMCEADYSGYPDCRSDTLQAMQKTLQLGLDEPRLQIDTPLMHISKAQSWQLTEILGGDKLVQLILEDSHSCYLGDRSNRFDWGYGCGRCPACKLRAQGFHRWQLGDYEALTDAQLGNMLGKTACA